MGCGRVQSPAPRARAAVRYWWPLVVLAAVLVAYGGLAGFGWWLLENAHETGARARQEFAGDEVEALSSLALSERHALSDRNHAIWALAQLADARALPALERLDTGRQCEHGRFVCQHELRKAIERCRGRNQPPRWMRALPLFPHPRGRAER